MKENMSEIQSECKTKPFEDWWAAEGRWRGFDYLKIKSLYEIFRFPKLIADEFFVPIGKILRTQLHISEVRIRVYLKILTWHKLLPRFRLINSPASPEGYSRIFYLDEQYWRREKRWDIDIIGPKN